MEMRQCKKQGWLSVHRPDLIEVDSQTEEKEREGTEIGELARSIFGKYDMVEISKDKGKMIRDTQTLIENGSKIIAEGSFSYNGCFCSTDLLRVIDKDKKIIELLERDDCDFRLDNGKRRMVKRKEFEAYISRNKAI